MFKRFLSANYMMFYRATFYWISYNSLHAWFLFRKVCIYTWFRMEAAIKFQTVIVARYIRRDRPEEYV